MYACQLLHTCTHSERISLTPFFYLHTHALLTERSHGEVSAGDFSEKINKHADRRAITALVSETALNEPESVVAVSLIFT